MGSTNETELITSLVDQCAALLSKERFTTNDTEKLKGIGHEALIRLAPSLPPLIATALQERTKGRFTVLMVDRSLVPRPLVRSVYFVRVATESTVDEPVMALTDGMILCEINPYRTQLVAALQL